MEIEGLAEFRATLRKISAAVDSAAQRELKRSALNIQNGARQRVPVKTGRLRNSISHELAADGTKATIGTNVKYAPRRLRLYRQSSTTRRRP
jgi:phage gpG-like protein